MSKATDTAVRPAPALASFTPCCEMGHDPDSPITPCGNRAEWAVRTHQPRPGCGPCPRIMLLCEEHLTHARTSYEEQWARVKRIPYPTRCGLCGSSVASLEDILWGIERITP